MFRSQLTGKQYGPGVKPVRRVIETRNVHYTYDVKTPDGVTRHIERDGVETVREIIVGPDE